MRVCASSASPGKNAPGGAVLSGQALLFTKTSEKKKQQLYLRIMLNYSLVFWLLALNGTVYEKSTCAAVQ